MGTKKIKKIKNDVINNFLIYRKLIRYWNKTIWILFLKKFLIYKTKRKFNWNNFLSNEREHLRT
jgi:hypothetical protein